MKLRKVLIANRGEIAVRAIRACHQLGMKVGVVFSETDAESLPVELADHAHQINGAHDVAAYLDQVQIIRIASDHGYDAIYPGYGFLSENASFSAACAEQGIKFVGPDASVLARLGDKRAARTIAEKAGLPILPGAYLTKNTLAAGLKVAREIGFPLLVKAAHGGGGRGIRIVEEEAAFAKAFHAAQREARLTFGEEALFLEKFLPRVHHIEFQVVADRHGHAVHLGERICSIQQRFQKVIEEAPSTILPPTQRRHYGKLAVKLIQAVGLVGVATVEFLYDQASHQLYFIEVNPRIQVEHPVTELISGEDLVGWQLRLADGEKLTLEQKNIHFHGHAIECRVALVQDKRTAAHSRLFLARYQPPGGIGIRVCSALSGQRWVATGFDPLLLKIVAHGRDRAQAIIRLRQALSELITEGVPTNLPLLQAIMASPDFQALKVDTHWLGRQEFTLPEHLPSIRAADSHPGEAEQVALLTAEIYRALRASFHTHPGHQAKLWRRASQEEGNE